MADFHLLRPWWLLTLIPIVVLAVIAWRNGGQQTGWSRLLPTHLKPLLLPESTGRAARWPLLFVNAALAVTALALAGPTWQRLPQPVFQLQAGSVVIMDMSLSVYSTDLAPNRLTQMRYKATDLVRDKLDGEIGLIAYAGDAFTISPLTGDGGNLTNLIRALSPDIMPTPGSYPIRALNLADQLLQDAGYPQGDIYWFTDGIDSRDQQDINDFLNRTQHRLNVLAVGTEEGAPITLPDGRLLRDASNNVVIPQLHPGALQTLAARSGGRYSEIRSDQQDLEYLSNQPPLQREGEASAMQAGDQWQDQGPWLIPIIMLLLLPLARRGALPVFVCFVLSSSLWLPAHANEREPLSWQDKLWQTPYQQTDQALRAGDNERAAQIAEDAWQRGTANYRAGNYDQALVDFSQLDSAEGFYNQGNTLMQMERYDEAKNAYAAALERRPNWPQAQDNMDLAEQLAEQQQQQSEDNQQGDSQNNNSQDQQGEQGEQQSGEQQQSESEQNDQQAGQQEQQQQEQQQESTERSTESEQQQVAPEGEQEKPLQSEFGDASEEELQQQMQQWLNRIEDDPAVLLRNKMRYEAQQRRRQSPPPGVEKQW